MTKLNKLAFKKIEDFDRNKLTGHTYNCPWNNDPQYTHLWNDLEHLKTGKVARCGQPETHSCVHRVEYSIAGFRNTCPIAGRCGTYATPAPLRFSQFDFKGRKIKGKIELNKVQFSFKQKNNGVDVANGREAKTWGGKFSKIRVVLKRYDNNKIVTLDSQVINKTMSINQYQAISVNFNLDKIEKNISSKTQRKTFNNNRTLDLSQRDNFAIELHYYRVENTNPSVIRLKDANINVTFTYVDKPYVKVSSDSNVINCSSKQITHTVKTNGEAALKSLTYKEIPAGFSKPTVSTDKDNYTKTFVWTYKQDLTDTKKTITYYTKANNFKAEQKITIKVYQNKIEKIIEDLINPEIINKPISTITQFIKGSEYNDKTTYISFNDLMKSNSLCYDKINLHIKNENQNELIFPYYGDNRTYQCQSSNTNVTGINHCFYEQVINKLPCGEAKVSADFVINNKIIKTVSLPSIMVISQSYSFKSTMTRVSNDDVEEVVNDSQYIRQPSIDDGDERYTYYITFTRVDTKSPGPIINSFYNETKDEDFMTAVANDNLIYDKDKIKFKIDINKIGIFKVGFYYSDQCKSQSHMYHEFHIIPAHNQHYDKLYIKEYDDNTYDSIVIREGDNNRVPVAITNIQEINSYNNIKICLSGGKTNISEIGFGKLTVTNQNKFAVNDLVIELNPLTKDEETGEYDWINLWETIFSDFTYNIFAYNTSLKGLIEVSDNGEDVYIIFKQINPGQEISVNLPFMSKNECTYYISLFINGIQLKRNTSNKFLPRLNRLCSNEDYAKFIVTDTMLLDLKINNYEEYINIDEHEYVYDNNCNLICNNNECNQCGPFTVLYSINNIDFISPIAGEDYFIRIGHSPELQHSVNFDGAYELNEDIEPFQYPLVYNYVKIIIAPKSNYENEEPITYTLKTDDNGEGTFYYTIPSTELRSYNTESLRINNKFGIVYYGNDQNNPCSEGFSNEKLTINENKFNTYIIIDEDFSQYKPGDSVPIHFQLVYEKTPYDNGIYINLNEDPFKADFVAGRAILIPVTYQGVKGNPNQVLETSIETVSDTLTTNSVSKKIYCNIDTQVKVDASLAKTLVQQNGSNTLNIVVKNGVKPNQRVKIRVKTDGYKITNINHITNGTYSINDTLMYWDIGNMDSYKEDQISIDLQAHKNASGQKNICIKAFDYLHEEGDSNE